MGFTQSTPCVKLGPKETALITANTNCAEDEIKLWYSQFLKLAPDGLLKKEQFLEFYQKLHPNRETSKLAQMVFKFLDCNKTGSLNFFEFFIPNALFNCSDAKGRASLLFDLFDQDKSGNITKKELKAAIEAICEFENKQTNARIINSAEKASEIMKRKDINCDKKLSKPEFIYALASDKECFDILSVDFSIKRFN